MKIKSLICVAVLGLMGLFSCNDLDLEPKGQFGEAEFFGNAEGIKFYFAGLYSYLPIEDFLYFAGNDGNEGGYRLNNGDDPWGTWQAQKHMMANMCGETINSWRRVNNDGPNYWRYDRVREVNVFIKEFPNYRSNFSEAEYNAYLGEAHFLRAYIYSGMAKRYGGVPIITDVLYPTDPPEVVNVHRNTEYDTWKFIYEDLKFAVENMTASSDKYRGTRWTALALQSRMMLYAATIAKYSRYLLYEGEAAYEQKFAGIDPEYAEEFFRYSLAASKELIEDGPYELYRAPAGASPDEIAKSYHDLFLDKASKETIFTKNYVHHDNFPRESYLIGHNWEALMLPAEMQSFNSSNAYPSLNFMRLFEGFPDLVADNGTPKRWDNRGDIRNGMEPRMRGIIYFNDDRYGDYTFNSQRGLYQTFTWQASAIIDGLSNEAPNSSDNRKLTTDINEKFNGVNIIGRHGMKNSGGGEDNCLTGAFVRKYIDETRTKASIVEHSSFQPWIVFRLGEIYLNAAEAAYELGLKDDANQYIRAIRQRAGCVKLDIDPNNVNQWELAQTTLSYPIEPGLQFIRDERNRELWLENHRWFDLRRWRNADRVLQRWIPRILSCYYVINEGKYIYLDEREIDGRDWNAQRQCYYQGIPDGEINKNPNLLPRNPLR